MLLRKFIWMSFLTVIALPVIAEQIKENNLHVRTWNQFAQDLLSFHKQRIKQMDTRIKKSTGGYSHLPEFYIEESYYDEERLIATITWEKENPQQLHTIEVFVHDDKDRVIRDYAAAYLPHYHNAPTQTLISLHNYSNGLHAFRSFDASGYRIIERCTGTYKGNDVNFILDEDEIAEALNDTYQNTGIMVTDKYQTCFGDLPQDVGVYTTPQ